MGQELSFLFLRPDEKSIEVFCELAAVYKDGMFDQEQHTIRIRSGGHNTEKVPLSKLRRDQDKNS
jgi:hypothetical protein